MSSAHVRAVLRHIRQAAAAREDRVATDDELLGRYVARRDEDAFAAILQRHGPMVLGVCRTVLRDLHDAEDAFQAAFLLLARKAASIHRREALSGWLYRVSYNLALRVKSGAERRRAVEQKAVRVPPPDPVFDMSLRSLQTVLFEELNRLPERYRLPLLLCGLEEQTLEGAARQLGWTNGAVKGRLQRGRRLLRARLQRRGLEIPIALGIAGLAVGTASARVPAKLMHAALQTVGAGSVPAEIAVLVQGVRVSPHSNGPRVALALLLATSVTVAAFGMARQRNDGAPQSPPAARPAVDANDKVEVRGRVIDPDGKPVVGAKLYIARPSGTATTREATSGTDGRFHFAVTRAGLEKTIADQPAPRVMAVADGLGCDWVEFEAGGQELHLRLVVDQPINPRILDLNGRPVAGARLTVKGVSAAEGEDLDKYFALVRKGAGRHFAKEWNGPIPGRPAVLTTDADGRFHLSGVGRERVVNLIVEGPAIATSVLDVMTRKVPSIKHLQGWTYGAAADYVAAASRPIRGVVRDKESGKPLVGVTVGSIRGGFCNTLTDADGRYEILGFGKASTYHLELKAADGLHFGRSVNVNDTTGLAPLTCDIELVKGLTVLGRVTEKATGKPVANARVDYHPLAPNRYTAKMPGAWSPRSETKTGPDGTYVLTVLPGPGVIGVMGPAAPDEIMPDESYMLALVTREECKAFFRTTIFESVFTINERQAEDFLTTDSGDQSYGAICQSSYNALLLLAPGERDTDLVKDVVLERPRMLKCRVIGPDGQPLTGVTVYGLHPYTGGETLKCAEFTVPCVNPRRQNRQLVFQQAAKKLGYFIKELRTDTTEPLTVKLEPCGSASGRMVDRDTGQPKSGLWILICGNGANGLGDGEGMVTDKDGRFRFEGLVPGQDYRVIQPPIGFYSLASVTAESGKDKDLGDVKTRPPN
jgi:RNA polymerase sigma factor (sigma-70 family)